MSTQSFGPDQLKHLEFIQTTITRFANSSFLIKGWTLTIAAAFFAVLANRLNWAIAAVCLVPLLAFWLLDGYFLWQERLFRRLYDDARTPGSGVALLSMRTSAYTSTETWVAATRSRTIALFYGALVLVDLALVVIAVVAG